MTSPERAPEHRCSGAMAEGHDGSAERVYRIGAPGRDVTLCGPCADAAARLGMIDRREGGDRRS